MQHNIVMLLQHYGVKSAGISRPLRLKWPQLGFRSSADMHAVPTPLSDYGSPFVEDKGNRQHRHTDEAEQGSRPLDVEGLVHLYCRAVSMVS